ncbi:alpha/beta fold hydrolase BchO [Salinarimonas sp.]|uniref:alpha/beta fold hydrolase BchO n=1 Tax=Salinarimonas sp. TaxID=2766526 RepID=UPI00391BC770
MPARLDFSRERATWPNADASAFVEAAGMRWHVQRMGEGPVLLLVHGTAATTHSFRDLMPILARRFDVIACDLPGHGFSDPAPHPPTLPAVARGIAELMGALGAAPALALGHSAGAAILVRAALDGLLAPRGIVGVNAAIMPFEGFAGRVFSPLAKLLVINPFVPRLFAAGADAASVERLLAQTGSRLDAAGVALYARAIASPGHVAGALAMMAHWNLDALVEDLTRLSTPLLLVVGERDRAVPPLDSRRVRALVRHARLEHLPRLGHVAHEEAPEAVAGLVEGFWGEVG